MSGRNGTEKGFDIMEGQKIFKIVDKDQHQHMISGILFLDRRGEEVIFGIVVNHGFRKNLSSSYRLEPFKCSSIKVVT